MILRLYFFLFVLQVPISLSAQQNSLYEKIRMIQTKGAVNLKPEQLVGKWESQDADKKAIEFYWIHGRLQLGKEAINSFYFSRLDSLSTPMIYGYLTGWPPCYCILTLVEMETISIEYYHFENDARKIEHYKKK